MSRTSPWRPRSSLLLIWVSLGVILLSAMLAAWSAWRSRANTRQLLRNYAAFGAWTYNQRLEEAIGEAIWLTLSPIGHAQPHRSAQFPNAEDLEGYRATNMVQCKCETPLAAQTYFRFSLGQASFDVKGVPFDARLASHVSSAISEHARQNSGGTVRVGVVHLPAEQLMLAYGLMPTTWGDTLVYGFTADSAAMAATFASVLDGTPLLPVAVTGDRPNRDIMTVEVLSPTNEVMYRAPHWPIDESEWPYIASDTSVRIRGGFVPRLALIQEAAPSLLSGGLPRTPLPLLGLIGVLGLGALLTGIHQLRREGELARMRSDFVAGVSHELRTPLAQLRLFLDTLRLKRYDTPAEEAWLVDHLTRETTRMEHLVENVLAASRLERGVASSAILEPLDLGAQVAEGVAAFAPLAASRKARLALDVEPGITVMGEQAALRQLVNNLLDNAVKFGPAGQEVRVSVSRHNGHAMLRVSDEGPGVPESERERIWEPYYRGGTAAARTVGGSGIGLAIVREVAGRFGAEAHVEEGTGTGAAFVVTFPRSHHPTTPHPHHPTTPPSHHPTTPH